MDLSNATTGQQTIITTLHAPLAVAAGAGSGKTFTLTNRIAYALIGEAGTSPAISSIEEVLAITFTKKAAAELKSRVRLLLQEKGLAEEARKVEDAWITTIHGMCSRILREHALELGIDPAFEVVEEAESAQLWQCALNTVLSQVAQLGGHESVDRLIAWYPEMPGFGAGNSLSNLLTNLWNAVLATPEGFDAVIKPECNLDIFKPISIMIELAEEYESVVQGWGGSLTKTDQKHFDALQAALERARHYCMRVDLRGTTFDTPQFDIVEYFDVLTGFPKLSPKYRMNKPDSDFFEHYRTSYASLVEEAMLDCSALVSADLLALTRVVDAEYQTLKGPDKLDNTDLLRKCKHALETHPEICEAYRQQFELIMVDEFQDTDLLQVAIITMLSRNKGENIATVGDAQQSIYRFRGADVEVFYDHTADQKKEHASLKYVTLPDNFRSHGDILAFVEKIFASHDFFSDRFLHLDAKGAVNAQHDATFDTMPRVEVNIFESRSRGGSLEDARIRSAQAIAERFAALREAGASPSEMVVLLGSMSKVGIYAQALRDAGFETIVAGGSVFASAKEVQVVGALLAALTNHGYSSALYTVLESPLFHLSDQAFYAIAHCPTDALHQPRGASFASRFWALAQLLEKQGSAAVEKALNASALQASDLAEIQRALQLLHAANDTLLKGTARKMLQNLLVDSGWLYRLSNEGAEGLAVAGNLLKAIGIVGTMEEELLSPVQVAAKFNELLGVSKEAPGALATLDTNFVRIMTIHASKGLEFPHVAVAEVRSGLPKDGVLRTETVKGKVAYLLRPALSSETMKTFKALAEYLDPVDSEEIIEISQRSDLALSPEVLSLILNQRIAQGEMDDAQRLLYVALTRASKSLCLCLTFEGNKDFNYEKKGIFDYLHRVLQWEKTEEPSTTMFDYGGSGAARLHHEVLLEHLEAAESEEQEETTFALVDARSNALEEATLPSLRANVASYSSLSTSHGIAAERAEVSDKEDLAGEEPFIDDDLYDQMKRASAVQLGTAFHLLAQRAIESRMIIGSVPEIPSEAVESQIKRNELTEDQAQRLEAALPRWFNSNLCKRFFSYEHIAAEVPFFLQVSDDETSLFLEGEIDGLAYGETVQARSADAPSQTRALLIDYKTGGNSNETPEALHEKHLLQAQCYALALIRQGFSEVDANFIRVERESEDDPTQPQVVTYTFSENDRAQLEEIVLGAYRAAKDA